MVYVAHHKKHDETYALDESWGHNKETGLYSNTCVIVLGVLEVMRELKMVNKREEE